MNINLKNMLGERIVFTWWCFYFGMRIIRC